MRYAGPARPPPHGVFRAAAVAVVVVAAGLTAGSAAAVGQQAARLRLAYSCTFGSGSRPVSVQVAATFPVAATAGKPIAPTATGITVTLPHSAAAGLAGPGATVTLRAGLSTEVTEGTTSQAVAWQGFRSAAAAIPRTGPLTLTATGAAPPVTPAASGEVTVTAGGLALLFTARTADRRGASPRATPVACVPSAREDTTLATIAVTGPAQARRGAATPRPADDPAKCLPFPKNLGFNPLFPLPKPPPGSNVIHSPSPACAYATGFADQRKLNEAALVGPGLTDFLLTDTVYTHFTTPAYTYLQLQEPGQLEYHGKAELPPARATVLGFGFMPVSATLQISEIGSINAALVACTPGTKKCPNSPPSFAVFYALVTLNVSDVDVNGVPLNVGPHCQTATPFDLELTGVEPSYNVGEQYGVLTGTVTVPPFKGCGVGENLDPLFDATVSGPGNFVKVTQAVFCTPSSPPPNGCPPALPVPKH